jgi:hypothetical protein
MTIPASTTGPSLPPTIDRQSAAGVYSGVTHAAVRRPSTTKVATLTYDDSSPCGEERRIHYLPRLREPSYRQVHAPPRVGGGVVAEDPEQQGR